MGDHGQRNRLQRESNSRQSHAGCLAERTDLWDMKPSSGTLRSTRREELDGRTSLPVVLRDRGYVGMNRKGDT